MKISYRRDLNRNYLIVSQIDDQSRAYEIRMFEKNGIRGFLPLQTRRMNGQMELWLDISGKQSLELLFENRLMSGADMENLFHGISESLEEALRGNDEYRIKTASEDLDTILRSVGTYTSSPDGENDDGAYDA